MATSQKAQEPSGASGPAKRLLVIDDDVELCELVARIRAVLRRTEGAGAAAGESERLAVGELVLDLGAREAWLDRRRLDLTAVEFDLLVTLTRGAGRVVSRDELSVAALGRPFHPLDRSVDMHVSNLRRKLHSGREGMPLIKTVRSAGYLLVRPAAREGT